MNQASCYRSVVFITENMTATVTMTFFKSPPTWENLGGGSGEDAGASLEVGGLARRVPAAEVDAVGQHQRA